MATTADEYIINGEDALFSGTIDGVLQAHSTFQTAQAAYTGDPVINAYLALTRLLDLALRQDGTGLTDLMAQFGIRRSGDSLDTLSFEPTSIDEEYLIFPESAPSGETIRSFLADTLLPAINASIANLDTTLSTWTADTDKHIISKTKLGSDMDIEVDNGDIYLFRAMLKFAKAAILTVTSYDLDVDLREIAALINLDAFNPNDFLQRYQNFLNLLTTSSTPSVEGATQLADAKAALIGAIDDYLTASDKILNDTDTAEGAEELIALSPDDEADEQLLRDNLTELKASLNESRAADLITERNGTEEKHLSLNLNPLFGNGSGPYNLRDFLPDFNCDGEPVHGTMAHGLGNDATVGGIFPDFTQDGWGLEGISASGEISIPQATINVDDGLVTDWDGIDPVFQDITGDGDPGYQGSDIEDVYLAQDDSFLYGRMTLADGPPNTATQSNPWEALAYFVQFRPRPDLFPGGLTVQVDYLDGNWRVQVWEGQEGYQSNMLGTYTTGYAEAVGNDLEWKVPLADLGSITGRFLAAWTQWIPYSQEPIDNNETCLQVGPLSSISGTLNVPAYDGAGPIYISVYRSENGAFNPEDKNLLGKEIIYPQDYSAGMSYVVDGLPVGEEVFVTARWDADYSGVWTRGDYVTRIGPYTVTAGGTTGANLQPATMYAVDDATPYFILCNVMAMNTPGGIWTTLDVMVGDPNGTVPDTIQNLTVSGPNDFTYTFTSADYYSYFNEYWHGIQGQPAVGEYTFTVTDNEGKTATSHYYFRGGTNIPVPDQSTLQASGDLLAPTLSWGAISGYQGNLFYRARIFDASDNSIVWTSGFTPFTSVQVPGGILQQGIEYKWRVEAFDNYTYFASNQRAVTGQISLTIEDSTPYFNWATVFHRKDSNGDWTQIEVSVADPDGSVPSSISSLEVYDPQGTLICSTVTDPALSYFSPFNEYWVKLSGTPTQGVYKFVVTDVDNNTKTAYAYVGPSFTIPLVDSDTLQASGDSTALTLSWAGPDNMDRPIYFRAIVEDTQGNRVWASDRIHQTSIQVPAGRLQSGGSYKWYVRTIDDSNWTHFSNQGRSAKVDLALDNSTPFFNWAAVYQRHDPDGVYTAFDVSIADPNGTLPDSITSLSVTDPNKNTYDLLANGVYTSYWTDFFLRVPGAPVPGVYTFTVTDNEGKTAVTHEWVGTSDEIPLVEQGSISVTGDPLAPTLSWSGISGYQGNLYYRIWVQDTEGNFVYMSRREPYTAQTIPEGKLEAGKTYLARVEAYDHWYWTVYNSRSNTGWVLWFTEGAPPAPVYGNINGDGSVTLADAILALQVSAGLSPAGVQVSGDVNGDEKIGLAEAIYILQFVAGMQ